MVFLMWGPLMVSGAYYVQAGEVTTQAIWVSLPFGILVALILLANNIRDIQYDGHVGIKTIAILLGRANALRLYQFLILLAYVGIIVLILTQQLSWWSLLILVSLPLALRLNQALQTAVPPDADARTAQLDTVFGLLLILSVILDNFF
jgi:1,4-dihydroxy-2-naphthoate octaprenyltransferase